MTFSFSSCQICIIGSIFQMKTWILKRNYVASLLMSWNQEIKELKFEYRSLILKLICNFTTVAETSLSECIGLVVFFFLFLFFHSGWCGSVDWVLDCKAKGCQFCSQSGHMPGLKARSPVRGVWRATTHWCFPPSLSPFLLSDNK